MSKLDEIEARAAEATKAPHWNAVVRGCGTVLNLEGEEIPAYQVVMKRMSLMEADDDAALVNAAPTDIAYLLRVARAAERVLGVSRYLSDEDCYCSHGMKCNACELEAELAKVRAALEGREL